MNKVEFPGFEEIAPKIKRPKKGEVPLATPEEEAQVEFWNKDTERDPMTGAEKLDTKREDLEVAYKEKFLVSPRDLTSEQMIAALADPEKEMIRLYDVARLEDNEDRMGNYR